MPTVDVPALSVRAAFVPDSWNPETRTIDLCWTTGAKGRRMTCWGDIYFEELEVSPQAIRMERLNSGAAVLDAHQGWEMRNQVAVVERAWIEGSEGMATVRFSEREEIADLVRDVATGVIRNVSVGYVVHVYETTEPQDGSAPTFRATDWEPYEISFVPIGFDAGAQTRGASTPTRHTVELRKAVPTGAPTPAQPGSEEIPMPDPITQRAGNTPEQAPPTPEQPAATQAPTPAEAERTRAREIRSAVRVAKLGEPLADELVDSGATLDQARARIIEKWGEGDQARGVSGTNVRVVRAEADTVRAGMEGALLLRLSPGSQLSKEQGETVGQFRHMRLMRMAEEFLTQSGVEVRGMAPMALAARALNSTSDFPNLLANVAHKRLRAVYEAAPTTYQRWARRAPNAPDFRDLNVVNMGGAPDLEQIGEGGEFAYGTIGEGGEKYRVVTYGKIVGFTRQAIVNDDLRAFERVLSGFASSARRMENRLVYKQLTTNPAMSDAVALFHASHGNLAGAGAAISVASLGAGRAAMRKQKGLANEELNVTPAYLLVPTDLEQLAYQYTSSQFTPTKAADTNEFRAGGRTALEPIVEPVLDASSTTTWYLVGDGMSADTVEYCWLDGAEGVYLESEPGFDVDGMKMKARLDFGAKVIDYRGLYQNPGA